MLARCWPCLPAAVLLLLHSTPAFAQATLYRLHNEPSTTTGAAQLTTAPPHVPTVAIQSTDLKGLSPRIVIIKNFDTQANVPGLSGSVAAGSTVTFALWMKKTAASGTMYPHAKLYQNNDTGALLCAVSGNDPKPGGGTWTAALSTTLTKYTFSCTTGAAVSWLASDRWYLSAGVNMTAGPGNKSVKVELDIEGVADGNYDSTVTVPAVVPPAAIVTGLTPPSGSVGTVVRVTGAYFGQPQGSGTIRFNGVTGSPSQWTADSIDVPVPVGATTGPVVVTGPGGASNSLVFTVFGSGTLSGSVSRSSGGTPIAGATVDVMQSGVVSATGATNGSGAYSIPGVRTGSYDVLFSAPGYLSEMKTGIGVTTGTTTLNAALATGGTISGNVTRTDGVTPIAGASIALWRGTTAAGATTTSAAGGYSVPAAPPGTYSVEAAAPGYHTARVEGVVLVDGGTATANFTLAAKADSTIRYVYDELGRLSAVIDPSGDTARFAYDAGGNITAIARGSSAVVAIVELVPDRGPVGTAVTIEGTGFSGVATENSVSFNGAPAAITSASPTRLVATVPSGASTGPVSVAAPGGAASSSGPFEVTAAAAVPTITGFTPTIGVPGTPFTINGTNFSTVVANNNVRLNTRRAGVASAAATQIASEVPGFATSGRVRVTTPLGTATSAGDFIVPPSPYTATDVEYSGRIAFATPLPVTFATTNKIGLLLFDGVKGREVSLTWSPANLRPVSVRAPDGTDLFGSQFGGGFRDRLLLPQDGTYTILLGPDSGSAPGTMTVTLFDVVDVTGPIVPGGTTVPISISTPGQNARFTFSNSVQAVSLRVGGVTIPASDVSILRPDGTTLVAPTYVDTEGAFFDGRYLTAPGIYTIVVNPRSSNLGNATLTLRDATDAPFTIVPDGPTVTATTTIEGQNARLTFSGAPGQRVTLKVSGITFGGFMECATAVSIVGIDGVTPLATNTCVVGTVVFEPVTLPASGTYAVLFDPQSAHVGSANFILYDVPPDVTGTITPDGDEVLLEILKPGQNAAYTIAGTAGQRVSLVVSENTISSFGVCAVIQILSGGVVLRSNGCAGSPNAFLDTTELTGAGPFTLTVNPAQDLTGSMRLKLHAVPPDATGTLVVNGDAVLFANSKPGQNGLYTFAGNTGQQVTVRISSNGFTAPGSCVRLRLYRGTGPLDSTTQLNFMVSCSAAADMSPTALPATMTYTVLVDPDDARVASLLLRVTNP